MSSLLARAVYGTLARTGLPALRRRRGGAPVFCFHDVVPGEHAPVGEASLHMTEARFREILDWMAATYTVVPLEELAGRVRAGRSLAGLAAVTFDDGCRGVYRHAAPALRAAGVPATSFVVSGAPDEGAFFWWDRLAHEGMLDPDTRTRCLEELRGEGSVVLPTLLGGAARSTPDLPDALRPAPWETVVEGEADGLAAESHTVSHPNLTRLSADELADELSRSRRAIGERVGRVPEALSYPYGFASPRVVDAARSAGYTTAVTLEPRPVHAGDDPLALPRLNVPASVALPVLECWAAGIRIR